MSIKKEKRFNKLSNEFRKMKTLLFKQFGILEEAINLGFSGIEEKTVAQFWKNERKLDQLELKMSDNIIQAIGLEQPVASELRLLISYFRMIGHIERIGDQIANIIRFLQKLSPASIPENQKASILDMFSVSQEMVKKALSSFEEGDRENAIWAIKKDELVDEMQYELLKRIVKKNCPKGSDPAKIFNFINFGSILGSIERIADNATNIAEASIYYQQGIDLRHKELPEEE